MSSESPRAVDIYGAANRTGLPVRTLRYRRQHGLAPPSYRLGSRVMYDLADLDAWMDTQKAQTLRGAEVGAS
ncbi:MerR family transcriptional regulator [Mycobacterium sp. 1164985.4]|uniref:helix-turn-helix transcriptional regulator n=1 Tax=Mycobacterium sp. 1164985.4 TaxID=1834069 RepID=UPI0007FCD071|nr:MerR family transcriptional regulator [Mycobacterium sp. 1164985.4]OBK82511.1 hypothetical protein A5650_23310 [Mycobacterium sp. 1164985.4]